MAVPTLRERLQKHNEKLRANRELEASEAAKGSPLNTPLQKESHSQLTATVTEKVAAIRQEMASLVDSQSEKDKGRLAELQYKLAVFESTDSSEWQHDKNKIG